MEETINNKSKRGELIEKSIQELITSSLLFIYNKDFEDIITEKLNNTLNFETTINNYLVENNEVRFNVIFQDENTDEIKILNSIIILNK